MIQYIDGEYLVTETGRAVIRELNRPAPAPVETLSGGQVLDALTDAEFTDLLAKVKINAQAELAYARLQRMSATPVDDARLNAVLDRMVAAAIITAARKVAILA